MRTTLLLSLLVFSAGCGLTLDFEPDEDAGGDVGRRDASDAQADARDGGLDVGDSCVCADGLPCDAMGECGEPCGAVVCRGDTSCVDGTCVEICLGDVCVAGEECHPERGCLPSCGGDACEPEERCIEDECVDICDPDECSDGEVCLEDTNSCGPCRPSADDCPAGLECSVEERICVAPDCVRDGECDEFAGPCDIASCVEGYCEYELEPSGTRCEGGLGMCTAEGDCRYCGDGFWDVVGGEECDGSAPESPPGCSTDCRLGCVTNADCREECASGICSEGECTGFSPPPLDCRECIDDERVFSDTVDADGDGFAACGAECAGLTALNCDCRDDDARINPRLPATLLSEACRAEETLLCGRDDDDDDFPGIRSVTAASPTGGGCPEGSLPLEPGRIDCLDAEGVGEDVFPGQDTYFPEGIMGRFDYNCDGRNERKYPSRFRGCDAECNGGGWAAFRVPSCGERGRFIRCDDSRGVCERVVEPRFVQTCR